MTATATTTRINQTDWTVTGANGVTVAVHAVNAAMTGWAFRVTNPGFPQPEFGGLLSRTTQADALRHAEIVAHRTRAV